MKKWKSFLKLAAIALAIYVAFQACNGCRTVPEEATTEDMQGKTPFRTECVLLYGYIDPEKVLKDIKNGIFLTAQYQKADGKLRVNMKNYLICVLEGEALKRGEELTANLRFTLYNGTSVKEDDECVRDVAIKYSSDFLGAQLDMYQSPEERLTLQNTATEEEKGLIILEFYPTETGDLMVDFSVTADEEQSVNEIDATNQAKVGKFFQDLETVQAELKTFEVGFISEEEYRNGNFNNGTIHTTPPQVGGQPFYMVVYYKLTTKDSFFNDQTFNLMTAVKGDANLFIEEASTSKIESITTEEGYTMSASFTVGKTIGSTKEGHVIYRVEPQIQSGCTMTVWISTDMNLDVDAQQFIQHEMDFYQP